MDKKETDTDGGQGRIESASHERFNERSEGSANGAGSAGGSGSGNGGVVGGSGASVGAGGSGVGSGGSNESGDGGEKSGGSRSLSPIARLQLQRDQRDTSAPNGKNRTSLRESGISDGSSARGAKPNADDSGSVRGSNPVVGGSTSGVNAGDTSADDNSQNGNRARGRKRGADVVEFNPVQKPRPDKEKKPKADVKLLDDKEAKELTPLLAAALQSIFILADQGISRMNRRGTEAKIWSTITDSECTFLADEIIKRGKVDKLAAQTARKLVNSYAMLRAGVILAPRFYQTALHIAQNGGVGFAALPK